MLDKLQIQKLLINGNEPFDADSYSVNDNLDAVLVYDNNVATSRVISYGSTTTLLTDEKKCDPFFKTFIEEFDDREYSDPRLFLIGRYQEYKYPFYNHMPTDIDNSIPNKVLMMDWCYNNLKEDEYIVLMLTSFNIWESEIKIIRTDVGVVVDYFDHTHDEPINTETYWFQDFEEDSSEKIYPVAVGLNAEIRPNISFPEMLEINNGMPFSLWYHTTFHKADDALDFLKEVLKDGVLWEDIGLDSKGGFWLSMDELSEVM